MRRCTSFIAHKLVTSIYRSDLLTVYTDSRAAAFINSFRLNPQSTRLTRSPLHLHNFDFPIFRQRGRINTVADALSRVPRVEPEIPSKDVDDDLLIFANEREVSRTQFDFDYDH